MKKRVNCKECPYKVKSNHNQKFPRYVEKMFVSGLIESKIHTCHMRGHVWSKPKSDNICVGSLEINSKTSSLINSIKKE